MRNTMTIYLNLNYVIPTVMFYGAALCRQVPQFILFLICKSQENSGFCLNQVQLHDLHSLIINDRSWPALAPTITNTGDVMHNTTLPPKSLVLKWEFSRRAFPGKQLWLSFTYDSFQENGRTLLWMAACVNGAVEVQRNGFESTHLNLKYESFFTCGLCG